MHHIFTQHNNNALTFLIATWHCRTPVRPTPSCCRHKRVQVTTSSSTCIKNCINISVSFSLSCRFSSYGFSMSFRGYSSLTSSSKNRPAVGLGDRYQHVTIRSKEATPTASSSASVSSSRQVDVEATRSSRLAADKGGGQAPDRSSSRRVSFHRDDGMDEDLSAPARALADQALESIGL